VDAKHFRKRAARAREMAKSGDDPRLAEMLLEVARDLDAEADAIDAECAGEKPHASPKSCRKLFGSLLWPTENGSDARPVEVMNISRGGAELRTEIICQAGFDVILHLPEEGLRLAGRIIRAAGLEAGMVFEPAATQDPELARYLRLRCRSEAVGAN
jgi:hypothetical protein